MTVEEALEVLREGDVVPSLMDVRDAREVVDQFAEDMARMLNSLRIVSFPLPDHLHIVLDSDDSDEGLYVTDTTALRVHHALGEALTAKGLL
jgi:hypothetical protein